MTADELLQKMKDGLRVRCLPKSVEYNEVRGEDSRTLYVGKKRITSYDESEEVISALHRLINAGKVVKKNVDDITYYEAL